MDIIITDISDYDMYYTQRASIIDCVAHAITLRKSRLDPAWYYAEVVFYKQPIAKYDSLYYCFAGIHYRKANPWTKLVAKLSSWLKHS